MRSTRRSVRMLPDTRLALAPVPSCTAPYASHIAIELWESPPLSDAGPYVIRLVFNGQAITRNVLGCGSPHSDAKNEYCPLEKLAARVSSLSDEFQAACSEYGRAEI